MLYVRGTRTSLGRWVRTAHRGNPGSNYDPHTRSGGNPPNSAYHMNLQQARFSLSAGFAARLEGGGAKKGAKSQI